MTLQDSITADLSVAYRQRLQDALERGPWDAVTQLAKAIRECWVGGRQIFLCGNGGSAGNAMHIANDFVYGIAKDNGLGLRALALPSNVSVVTCLGNDLGYDHIFSAQLAVQAQPGDLLIALSGSGNSPNILLALDKAKQKGVKTFAILGYSGGKAKAMADVPIHFAIDDMQISEDVQLIVAHMIMQWLYRNPPG